MPGLPSILVATSAFVILGLGCAHLLFTFRGNKFHPRDLALMARMQEVSPVISRKMSMWNAWVGFNASHSFGAMLFGLVYGYLALAQPAVLFSSWFLLAVGLSGWRCSAVASFWAGATGSALRFEASSCPRSSMSPV